jgi:hypothetical protein
LSRLTDAERRARDETSDFIQEGAAAELIGISRQRLYTLRKKGRPVAPWIRRGALVLYNRAAILAAVELQWGVTLGLSAAELRERLASGGGEWGWQDVLRSLGEHEATCPDCRSASGPCPRASDLAELLQDVLEDEVLAERLHDALRLGTAVGREAAMREATKIWWRANAVPRSGAPSPEP